MGLFIMILSACAEEEIPAQVATSTPARILDYLTPTATLLVNTPIPEVEPTEIPLPTATPFLYTVVANDTMGDIAYKYGVELNDLLTANPSVDPGFLSIGIDLIIPTEGEDGGVGSLPVLSPETLTSASEVKCYLTAEGGATCFWLLTNDQETPVENVSARVSLLNNDGELITSGTALLPLNVLPVGATLPVMVTFPSIAGSWTQAQAQVLTALPVINVEERYLDTSFLELLVTLGADSMFANVSGLIALVDPAQSSSESWILAVAYDQRGTIVGVRRWESLTGLQAGEQQTFSMYVYSLGSPISEVKMFLESRP